MISNFKKLLAILLIIAHVLHGGHASDYFASTAGLENLLKTELHLATEMQNYIDNLNLHIEMLQSEMNLIRHEHWSASKDLEGYLNNPINAYRLIKRLHSDWSIFEDYIVSDTARSNFLEIMETLKQNLNFPTNDDMLGSTVALVRLQKTYQLDVTQVASGIINGIKYGTPMTWQDCYAVGEYLYGISDYNHTIPWFKQTTKLLQETVREDKDVLDVLETLAEYHSSMGDYESALELLEYILERDGERESALETKLHLEHVKREGVPKKPLPDGKPNYHDSKEYKIYEQVCRGEFDNMQSSQQKFLLCKYHTNREAYRFLQPYKLEQLSLDPYVIQVYDVLTDHQMKVVKRKAKPHMIRSKVFTSSDDSDHTVADYRTSKTAWFDYSYHRYVEAMRQHVTDITGLNCTAAEDMQIANYGMGGHYEPHFDFFTEAAWFSSNDGNRIATAMFYLSDVEEGGGTAFPFLKILVKPRKGSMLFWFNLHASGDEDYRTKHAGCPVLKGSKWIANIWVRERDQFVTKPCDLTTNHEESLIYKNFWEVLTPK